MKQMFKTSPAFKEIDAFKIMYNVGCLLDIPTGTYIKGAHGESILNGGLGVLTAIAGRGNTFKSTLAHYMVMSAVDKIVASGYKPYINTYDTEMNFSIDRLENFTNNFDYLKGLDIFNNGVWTITDKNKHMGNEWYTLLRDFLKNDKLKNKKEYTVDTPFISPKGEIIKTIFPSFGEIDSMSEFETSDIQEIQNKNELGESGGNTIHMRLGLAKTRLLMELPSLCNNTGHYMVMTAHLGQDTSIQQSQYSTPAKKLQYMRMGEKIKGVTDKFFFLPNLFWQTVSSSSLNNQSTKGPEYPKLKGNQEEGSHDLNIITIRQLRNKSGPSGTVLSIIVSQSEGILPSLTEFHYIKENDRFGLDGSNLSYNLVLYPEVKLSRTTVRNLIDSDYKLRRAIKITADLLQMTQLWRANGMSVPTPNELYNKLKDKYDWNILLETRDWWTFNNDKIEKKFLSTMDLINMYNDTYVPYWLNKQKK